MCNASDDCLVYIQPPEPQTVGALVFLFQPWKCVLGFFVERYMFVHWCVCVDVLRLAYIFSCWIFPFNRCILFKCFFLSEVGKPVQNVFSESGAMWFHAVASLLIVCQIFQKTNILPEEIKSQERSYGCLLEKGWTSPISVLFQETPTSGHIRS